MVMRNKEDVRQELIKAGVGCMFFEVFWLRKIRLFAENLRENEHMLGGVWCFFRKHWGRLVATETRIFFLEQKGLFGSVVESFNYKNLNSVEITKGLIFSEMTITSGMAAQQVQWVPKFQLTPFMQLIQERLDDLDGIRSDVSRGKPHDEQVDEELQPDLVDLLKRLDQMKKKGMLTEEEFETQKSRLLT
jgi:hypothetical protein